MAVAQIEVEWTNFAGILASNAGFAVLVGLEAETTGRPIEISAQNFSQISVVCGKTNAIPIEMVRVLLSDSKLTTDWKPEWKFYAKTATK